MKKLIRLFALLAVVLCAAAQASALPFDKYSINRKDLPKEAQEMLSTHFPKAKVSMVKTDKHLLRKADYDVKLTNGTRIDFNSKGKWTEVSALKAGVPESLMKKTMVRYLKKNHPDTKVVRIKKSLKGYELVLESGHSLKFNLVGSHTSTTAAAAADLIETPDDDEATQAAAAAESAAADSSAL